MLSGTQVDDCLLQSSLNATDDLRYTHAAIYSILTLFGSVLNVLLLVVIKVEWKRLNESNFYCLVVSLKSV
ncbi:hypothetical protein L596_022520 [Steinernema carpocapsae]|uniref:Uncharacterized protein n=1 Tax=Steinernema carpocapsae TaxID=34508 RepID=A0A4U5MLZ9_STECR|nr:hypothetical protein L596_022520 [Steinernema carpocapsae]